jgi:hypothetical protein
VSDFLELLLPCPSPITALHSFHLHHDGRSITTAKEPSIICNSTNELHTHLVSTLNDNVQKQQGKQISIDLFMNKKSLTIACVCVDIMTASRQHPMAPSNSLFQHVQSPGHL